MRRLALSLLFILMLAACAGVPQTGARSSGKSVATRSGGYKPPPGFPTFVDHSTGREEVSIEAMGLVGVPYRWGGNTPDAGFDCSGLVHYVLARAASVDLPRTTADMSTRGESIEPDEIAPGDLVFFNTTGRAHSHVGIYVGKLRFVNAPSTGGTVRLDYLTNPYWAKHFDGIRRVAAPLRKPAPFDAPTYQAQAPAPVTNAPVTNAPVVAATAVAAPTIAAAPPPAAISSLRPSDTLPANGISIPTQHVSSLPADTSPYATAASSYGASQPAPRTVPATPGDAATANASNAGLPRAPISNRAPDAIDAAADAFEPAPSVSVAERQAQQARVAGDADRVQIMRASTDAHGVPARTQTSDDPIARFANGSY